MKVLTSLGLAVAILVVLCACSLGGAKKRIEERQPVTLTFMLMTSHFKDFLKESIQAFERENDSCKIDVQMIPDNQWINMIKIKAFTNETPDIVRIDKSVMMQIGTSRFVETDASESWMERVIPEELDSKLIDGKLYGLPVVTDSTVGIVCNETLFIENGLEIPNSIDKLWQVCENFCRLGITPLYASDKDSWTVQTWFTSAAPQVAPAGTWDRLMTNRLKWSGVDEFKRVLDDMAALRTKGYTNADHMMATYDSAVDAMANGSVAMYVSGHFFINGVLAANPDIKLSMAPMVYADSVALIKSQGLFAIFKKSEHVELAKTFLNWFSQSDNMDTFTTGWGYKHIFKDQKAKLPEWLEGLNENYINPGKTVLHVDSQLVGVDFMDFWGYQQELVGGEMTAEEALRSWDEAYAQQMRNRKMPGWQ